MGNNEIKKELYKQKPIAIKVNNSGGYDYYTTKLSDGELILFGIPEKESTFENEVPAQLLIRWLKNN